jgi:cytochrome b6-f complex iron-sulfur subunit
VLLVAVPVLVALGVVVLIGAVHRRDTDQAIGVLSRQTVRADRASRPSPPAPPPPSGRDVEHAAALAQHAPAGQLLAPSSTLPDTWKPPDPEAMDVTRRQFFNRGIVTFFSLGLTGFGAACLAFLWPKLGVGFGGVINLGSTSDVDTKIADGDGFAYYPEGRMWVTHYPAAALATARRVYSPPEVTSMEAGYTALYQKCPHLGCRVPECKTSQWFECQCHGSQYNRNGEKKGGPAPRGMDRFPLTVDGGRVSADTGIIISGPPIGTNTTGQEAEGAHCVSGAGATH